MVDKVFALLNRVFDACLLVALVLCFLAGLYSMVDSVLVYQQASDDSLLAYKPGSTTQEQGSTGSLDNIAWLTVDDTTIDYPVMQGTDNREYLNKDPHGEYSLSGSIFLDSGNQADFSDSYNLVYGHHMDADKMFGPLDYFVESSFFESHRTGSIELKDGTYYRLDFFAAVQTTAENQTVFDVQSSSAKQVLALVHGKGNVSNGTNVVQYRTPANHKKVVALSTCEDVDTTRRTVVFATMTRTKKPASTQQATTDQEAVQRPNSIVPWLILAAAVALVVGILAYRRRGDEDDESAQKEDDEGAQGADGGAQPQEDDGRDTHEGAQASRSR